MRHFRYGEAKDTVLEKLPTQQIIGTLLYTALMSESNIGNKKIKSAVFGNGARFEEIIEVSLKEIIDYIKINKEKIPSNHFNGGFINLKELHLHNIVILRSDILLAIDIDKLRLLEISSNIVDTKREITNENGKKQLIEERKVPNIPYNQALMHFIKKLRSPDLTIRYNNCSAQSCLNDTPIRRGNLKNLEYYLETKEIKHKYYSSMLMLATEPTINHFVNQKDKRNACIVEIYYDFSDINLRKVQYNFEAFKRKEQAFRK